MFTSRFNLHISHLGLRYVSVSKSCQKNFRNIDKVIPKNALQDFQNSMTQENGKIYDSKPFKIKLQKNKLYAWCLCGHSKSQPICDCTHKIKELNINLRPIFFKVDETKEYWLCNCKQTAHRPFCDGSHVPIQEAEEREKLKREGKDSET